MVEDFVDAIFPLVRESLYVETLHPKVIKRNHSKHTHMLSLSLSHTHTHIQTHQDVYYWCKKIKSYPNHCCHIGEMILLKDQTAKMFTNNVCQSQTLTCMLEFAYRFWKGNRNLNKLGFTIYRYETLSSRGEREIWNQQPLLHEAGSLTLGFFRIFKFKTFQIRRAFRPCWIISEVLASIINPTLNINSMRKGLTEKE